LKKNTFDYWNRINCCRKWWLFHFNFGW